MLGQEIESYWTDDSYKPNKGDIYENYQIEELIVETNCSIVVKAKDITDKSEKALKFIKYKNAHQERYQNEINILRSIDHPNILKLERSILNPPYLVTVTKFSPYKDLVKFTKENYPNGMPENLVRTIMFQILDAVDYLHSNEIIHRDIKPQNILVIENEPEIKVALIDFGFAKKHSSDKRETEYVGTEIFAPPEILLRRPYSNLVDIWPIGITMYYLLANRVPYSKAANHSLYLQKVINGSINKKPLRNNKVSNEAVDMIEKMCRINWSERPSAESLKNHPWMKNGAVIIDGKGNQLTRQIRLTSENQKESLTY